MPKIDLIGFTFEIGQRVKKKRGAEWQAGKIVEKLLYHFRAYFRRGMWLERVIVAGISATLSS